LGNWSYRENFFGVDQCEPESVPNCYSFLNGIFCLECLEEYVPQDDKRSCYKLK